MEENIKQSEGMVDIQTFLNDPNLVKKINGKINAYNLRPGPSLPKGSKYNGTLRYRRTPEDELIKQGNFNALFMIDEFIKTLSKTSKLSRSLRTCVEVYVVSAMQELYYESLKAKENGSKEESGDQGSNEE